MEKEFCTYEQSLALKELGFDEPCLARHIIMTEWEKPTGEIILQMTDCLKSDKNLIKAPLKQQAFRWLYHKLNIKDGAIPLNEEAQNTLLKELLDKLSSKHLLA